MAERKARSIWEPVRAEIAGAGADGVVLVSPGAPDDGAKDVLQIVALSAWTLLLLGRDARRCRRDRQSSVGPSAAATRRPMSAPTMRGTWTWHVSTITLTRSTGVPATAVPAMKTPGTFVSIVSWS